MQGLIKRLSIALILSQWFLIHPVFALQSQYASNANKIIILSKSAMSSAVPVDIPAIFNTRISQTSAEEILTITGEGFKLGPTVILYDNFSNGSDGEIIPLDSPHIGQWSSNLGSTHFEQYNSNEMGLAANNFKDWSSRPTLVTIFPQRTANLFLSYSVYMPPGATFSGASTPNTFPSISSWKFTWLTDGENGYYDREGKADLCVPSHAGRGSMIIGGNDGTLSYVSGGPVWWDFKQTNFISFYTKTDADAPQTENGTLFFQVANVDKGLYQFIKTDRPAALAPPKTYEYDRLRIPGWWGNGDSKNFQAIYDNVYMAMGDNYIARIELTDSQVYSESTEIFVIPAEQWQDDKITINLQKLSLPGIKKRFIYIIDRLGVRSKKGYAVCENCL